MSKQKERPILMSGAMVRAILEGRKKMTRRVVKPQPPTEPAHRPIQLAGGWNWQAAHDGVYPSLWRDANDPLRCPYGVPGDRLYVKESYRFTDDFDRDSPSCVGERCIDAGYRVPWAPTQYEADGHRVNWQHISTPPHPYEPPKAGKLRPSIHMPRWASRLTLEVVNVRVERLQDISEEDAIAEGVERTVTGDGWRRYAAEAEELAGIPPCVSAARSFQSLWLHINGLGSWDANPYVWVVEFKRQELGA